MCASTAPIVTSAKVTHPTMQHDRLRHCALTSSSRKALRRKHARPCDYCSCSYRRAPAAPQRPACLPFRNGSMTNPGFALARPPNCALLRQHEAKSARRTKPLRRWVRDKRRCLQYSVAEDRESISRVVTSRIADRRSPGNDERYVFRHATQGATRSPGSVCRAGRNSPAQAGRLNRRHPLRRH
jgi:hypothetical protein